MIRVTAVVVVVEALVLRAATRVFIHVPGLDVTTGIFALVADLARLAFRMAVPLTVALLVVLAAVLWRSHQGRAFSIAITAFMAAVAAGGLPGLRPTIDLVVIGLVTVVMVLSLSGLNARSRIPVAMWGAAFLMSASAHVFDQWAADGTRVVSMPWLHGLAEGVALAALLSAPMVLRDRLTRIDWVVGTGIASVLAIGLLGTEAQSAARIVLLWNLGLAGTYPVIVYALAFGSLGMTVVALIRSHRVAIAAAMIFMGAAGFGLFSSYQTMLLVTGLVVISDPVDMRAAVRQPEAGELNVPTRGRGSGKTH